MTSRKPPRGGHYPRGYAQEAVAVFATYQSKAGGNAKKNMVVLYKAFAASEYQNEIKSTHQFLSTYCNNSTMHVQNNPLQTPNPTPYKELEQTEQTLLPRSSSTAITSLVTCHHPTSF